MISHWEKKPVSYPAHSKTELDSQSSGRGRSSAVGSQGTLSSLMWKCGCFGTELGSSHKGSEDSSAWLDREMVNGALRRVESQSLCPLSGVAVSNTEESPPRGGELCQARSSASLDLCWFDTADWTCAPLWETLTFPQQTRWGLTLVPMIKFLRT